MSPLRVLHPCDEDWEAMPGTDRVRHCDACEKKVHDVRHLSEGEIRGYVGLHGASLCVRMLAASIVAFSSVACETPKLAPAVPAPTGVHVAPIAEDSGASSANEDADKDGIVDAVDACPQEPGGATADPRTNGCPRFIRVETMGELQILQMVHFVKSKTIVAPEAEPIIRDMVDTLNANPDITLIEVRGYASLDEASPQRLSQKRAEAVMAKVVAAGIDPKRVVAKGFGATKPVADNSTEETRQTNRRVEFHLAERKDSCAIPDAGP